MERFFFFFSSRVSCLSVFEDTYISRLIMSIRIYRLDLSFTLHCFTWFVVLFVCLFVCLLSCVQADIANATDSGMRVGGYREVVCRIFPFSNSIYIYTLNCYSPILL